MPLKAVWARAAAAALLLSGCSGEKSPQSSKFEEARGTEAASPPAAAPADRTPVEERPWTPDSAEGAAQVVQTYYALIEAGEYADAYKLREPAPDAPSAEEFASSFDRYAEYHVTIGRPSEPVESGGWHYVEVPVQPYGRLKDGSPLASAGTITLRRKQGGEWRIFTNG